MRLRVLKSVGWTIGEKFKSKDPAKQQRTCLRKECYI